MSLTFVQGDTAPDITTTITVEDDPTQPIDLNTVSGIRFQMRKANDRRYTVNAEANIIDAVNGKCSYTWGANDLSIPGEYQFQWEITYIGGRIQTTAPIETLTIRRQ